MVTNFVSVVVVVLVVLLIGDKEAFAVDNAT